MTDFFFLIKLYFDGRIGVFAGCKSGVFRITGLSCQDIKVCLHVTIIPKPGKKTIMIG